MKLWSIQVLRFVAALLVVYFHAVGGAYKVGGPTYLAAQVGYAGRFGVDIFFVISGFVIARSAPGLSVGAFLSKRIRRIFPLYFALTIPWVLVSAFTSKLGWRDVLATGLLWPATDRITQPLNPVGWTLCFEMLFYASFAITLWSKRAALPLMAVAALALFFHSWAPALEFLGNPLILEFLAGVAIAYAPAFRPAVVAIPIGAALLFAGTLFHWPPSAVADVMSGQGAWVRTVTMGIPAALVVLGTVQLRFREGVLTYLGDASYALYLVHLPIVVGISAIPLFLPWVSPPLVIATSVVGSIVAAWRVHEAVEKPLLSWLRTRGHSLSRAPGRSVPLS